MRRGATCTENKELKNVGDGEQKKNSAQNDKMAKSIGQIRL